MDEHQQKDGAVKMIVFKNGIKLIPESNLDNDLLHAWDSKTVSFSETHCVNPSEDSCGFRLLGKPFVIETFISFKDKP